jgi:hypothetical protein
LKKSFPYIFTGHHTLVAFAEPAISVPCDHIIAPVTPSFWQEISHLKYYQQASNPAAYSEHSIRLLIKLSIFMVDNCVGLGLLPGMQIKDPSGDRGLQACKSYVLLPVKFDNKLHQAVAKIANTIEKDHRMPG